MGKLQSRSPLPSDREIWYNSISNPPGSAEAEQGLSRKVGALAVSRGLMKNTIVYIDGYNLYYGLLQVRV